MRALFLSATLMGPNGWSVDASLGCFDLVQNQIVFSQLIDLLLLIDTHAKVSGRWSLTEIQRYTFLLYHFFLRKTKLWHLMKVFL